MTRIEIDKQKKETRIREIREHIYNLNMKRNSRPGSYKNNSLDLLIDRYKLQLKKLGA